MSSLSWGQGFYFIGCQTPVPSIRPGARRLPVSHCDTLVWGMPAKCESLQRQAGVLLETAVAVDKDDGDRCSSFGALSTLTSGLCGAPTSL